MSFKSKIRNLVSSKIAVTILILIIILAVYWIISANKSATSTSQSLDQPATSTPLTTSTVRVTGKIAPVTKSELGFDRSGVISTISVRVGDKVKAGEVLIALDSYGVQADIASAEAGLAAEESSYKELERGLRTEEYSVERSKVVSGEVELSDAILNAQNTLREAYVDASKAMRSYVGTFFTNSYVSFPEFTITTRNQNTLRYISSQQNAINSMFDEWRSLPVGSTSAELVTTLKSVRNNLDTLKQYFSLIEEQIVALDTNGTGYTSAQITSYRSTMITANELLNTVFDNVVSAEGDLLTAIGNLAVTKNEFALKNSGTSSENLDVARAKVSKARAELDSVRAQFNKTRLVSPIDGIVSWLDVDVGEAVVVGKPVVNVISSEPFKIEVFVPEVDIANVKLGNEATVTLDAYGPDITWKAVVSAVDPAETIVEGVSTYKVTLKLADSDERIKSGMTANIEVKI